MKAWLMCFTGSTSACVHAGALALEDPMDITPDEITIQAVVEACFELVDRRDAPAVG